MLYDQQCSSIYSMSGACSSKHQQQQKRVEWPLTVNKIRCSNATNNYGGRKDEGGASGRVMLRRPYSTYIFVHLCFFVVCDFTMLLCKICAYACIYKYSFGSEIEFVIENSAVPWQGESSMNYMAAAAAGVQCCIYTTAKGKSCQFLLDNIMYALHSILFKLG